MEKRSIYVVLSQTGTVFSRALKFFTRAEYNHASISLTPTLDKMYSFGRLNPYNPFIGGFVHEYIDKGTFKRFKNTKALILEIEVTNDQYKKIIDIIKYVKKNKEKYKFNVTGMFLSAIKVKVRKRRSFYCAQFVKYLLDRAKVENNIEDTVRPENFKNLPNSKEIYKGLLRNYKEQKNG